MHSHNSKIYYLNRGAKALFCDLSLLTSKAVHPNNLHSTTSSPVTKTNIL